MSFKKPNFFILGAPKCGTTSLAKWLGEHPDIYFSKSKEPHYFNKDGYQSIENIEEYENLFKSVGDEKWVGEGSTWYMYSNAAVKNILEYTQNPKFIVCLRNPVDMCQSLYYQHVQNGDEHIKTFEEAWNSQEERAKGNNISRSCRFPKRLIYGEVCKIGTQLERIMQLVDKEDLHVILLDDLKKDSKKEFQKILRFLDVEDYEISFEKYNTSQVPRFKPLISGLNVFGKIKKKLNLKFNTGLGGVLKNINSKEITPRYDTPIKEELINYFKDEVKRIEKATNRSFKRWLK